MRVRAALALMTVGLAAGLLALPALPSRGDPPATVPRATFLTPPGGRVVTEAGPEGPGRRPADSKELTPNLAEAPPALPAPPQVLPIDLCTALRIAETDNPTIGISLQAIQEALAEQQRANALLLPSLRIGTNYHNHQGILQNSFGKMRHVREQSLYAGGGARTLAAETIGFPMVQLLSPLADAFFEPLVARRLVAVRSAQADATANETLLVVSSRFLELVTAEAELAAMKRSENDLHEVVELTTAFARAGRAREADASRARGAAQLLHVEEQRVEERVAVASADLAEVLNLDTAIRLQSPAGQTGLLQLVPFPCDLDELVREAQASRPDLAAIGAEIARRDVQVRQEQWRPFLPTLAIGYSTGTFGGGTNRVDLVPVRPGFGKFGSRADFDVLAYWTALNMGAGNVARQNERRAQRAQASAERQRLLNLVRQQVVTAYSHIEAGMRRVEATREQLRTAEEGYAADLRRIRGGEGLPIEMLNSVERLVRARVSLIESLLEYNRGQMELFVALGRRPTIACPPPAPDAPPTRGLPHP